MHLSMRDARTSDQSVYALNPNEGDIGLELHSSHSLHVMGTFMCPCNAPMLYNGHIYMLADVVCNVSCVVKKLG